jgi:hypothetical protein
MLLSAAVHVMVMRTQLQSQLPIEVVYYGSAEYDGQAVAIIKGGPKQCTERMLTGKVCTPAMLVMTLSANI